MLRSSAEQNVAEPLYTLQAIIDGQFDADLQAWCAAAQDFGTPLLAEYGTEVNGEWFSWNGKWNGAGNQSGYGDPTRARWPRTLPRRLPPHHPDLPQRWARPISPGSFTSTPTMPLKEAWNRFENYYPGDGWIDWIAVSLYGAQTPLDDYCDEFRLGMDAVYPRMAALAPDKPFVLAEFGVAKNNPLCDQAEWARSALTDIVSFRWPRLTGFSWWNEWWQNDGNPAHDTTMRLQDNAALAAVFQELAGNDPVVLSRIASPKIYLPYVQR